MPYNTNNYFAYKKNKYRSNVEQTPKTISKAKFLFQLFIATFIIMFIVIVFAITKFSSKVDIEYSGRNGLNNNLINESKENYQQDNETQRKIDKRLILIQQEENAPSEAKVIKDEQQTNEIINPIYLERNKKIEKEQQNEIKNIQVNETDNINFQNSSNEILPENQNVTIMSKVLIGKFSTFEEAKRHQDIIKIKEPALSPYVKKIGEVFAIQVGSYKELDIAKARAHSLKSKGYEVWIYQQ